MGTQATIDNQIADYICQMCRELAGMANKANLPLASDLLALVAIQVEQHSQSFDSAANETIKARVSDATST